MNGISGVYAIKNKVNGKYYIGSSKHIRARWSRHKNELRNHKHYNEKLQSDYNEYGESAFEYIILLQCPYSEAKKKEEEFIQIFNAETNGYNVKFSKEYVDEKQIRLSERVNSFVSKSALHNGDCYIYGFHRFCENISKKPIELLKELGVSDTAKLPSFRKFDDWYIGIDVNDDGELYIECISSKCEFNGEFVLVNE